jgi:hypothetical protein
VPRSDGERATQEAGRADPNRVDAVRAGVLRKVAMAHYEEVLTRHLDHDALYGAAYGASFAGDAVGS